MDTSLLARLAVAAAVLLAVLTHADNGCSLDPSGCAGSIVASGVRMDPNGSSDIGPTIDPNG